MVMGSTPGPNLHQCLRTHLKVCWLPCWPLYSLQVSHQRWIWGSHRWESMQKGIHPGFETQGRRHQWSKTGVSVEFFTNAQSWQCWHYFQLCIPIYLWFFSLFFPTDVRFLEIRSQGVYEDYVSKLNALLDWVILNGRAKTKLAMLAFLYCGKFVKNSSGPSCGIPSRFHVSQIVCTLLCLQCFTAAYQIISPGNQLHNY